MVSAACVGVLLNVVSVRAKNAATASELTIFASADNGATSSYQPMTKSAATAASTGAASASASRPPSAAAGKDAGDDGDAAERRCGCPVPAVGTGRNDGAGPDRGAAHEPAGGEADDARPPGRSGPP